MDPVEARNFKLKILRDIDVRRSFEKQTLPSQLRIDWWDRIFGGFVDDILTDFVPPSCFHGQKMQSLLRAGLTLAHQQAFTIDALDTLFQEPCYFGQAVFLENSVLPRLTGGQT